MGTSIQARGFYYFLPERAGPRWYLLAVLILLTVGPDPGWAQVPTPQLPLPLPPKPPPLPEKPPPTLPPPLVPPAPPALQERKPSPLLPVFVREIRLIGNTVFSAKELSEVTAPYTNREVTSVDLETLRLALTLYYVNRGYVTSGAIIPDQTITDGVVTIQIIEGKLQSIEVEGNKWFYSRYFERRIALAAGPPLNVNALQERLQLLQTDPRIQRLNAELRPGVTLGESILNLRVTEANPFKAWLEFNNFQSPTVGAEQGLVTVAHQNLTGWGDTLSLQYGRSRGVDPLLNFRYAVPVTARDTTLSAHYRRFDFAVQEDPFEPLDIENQAEIIGVSIRQPLYRTLQQEFAVALTAEHETNKTFLLGQPFEFVPGATNGVFRVSVLRFSQEWVHQTGTQVISALSRFSFGIGVLGATATGNPAFADGRFFSWLGEAQWARQIQPLRMQLLARSVLQLSNDHLFPLEQIAVGGRYSVRGYREYTLVRDNAFLASFESRIPVLTSTVGRDLLYVVPFVDVGRSWDTTVPTPDPKTLASVGLGLIWNITSGSRFEVYWGQRLNDISSPNGNLQDHGIHLQLVVQAF
jgi:hemolysin activation/secretion protein